jgi:hypothetical protein
MIATGSSHSFALLLAIFLPQRAALSPFIDLSEFPGPALFEQNAVVWTGMDGVPELVLLTE